MWGGGVRFGWRKKVGLSPKWLWYKNIIYSPLCCQVYKPVPGRRFCEPAFRYMYASSFIWLQIQFVIVHESHFASHAFKLHVFDDNTHWRFQTLSCLLSLVWKHGLRDGHRCPSTYKNVTIMVTIIDKIWISARPDSSVSLDPMHLISPTLSVSLPLLSCILIRPNKLELEIYFIKPWSCLSSLVGPCLECQAALNSKESKKLETDVLFPLAQVKQSLLGFKIHALSTIDLKSISYTTRNPNCNT